MPPYIWQVDPIPLIQQFETRHNNPTAGALFSWAVSTVDCLYYLDDIDRNFDGTGLSIAGHKPDVVDVAHARWATSTAITSLDLCAAGLGRAFCGHGGARELDISDMNASRKAQLPPDAKQWIDSVHGDPKYNDVKSARDWLTHSRLKRHFFLSTRGPYQRIKLEFNSTHLSVRDLVELSRDLATRHVSNFLQTIHNL